MNLAYYEDRFSRLNLNKSAGRVSPHKVAMLLAVMDLIESGKLAANRIPFDEPLLIAFTRRFDELSSEGDVNNPHLPFSISRRKGFGIWS